MQSATGGSGGGAGNCRDSAPAVRSSTSASASPSSSSSAVSAPHLGFDLVKHQQQIAFRQSLQLQQQLRKSDGDEPHLAYQAGGVHGVIPLHQQSRKIIDLSHQQHSGSQISEENQNNGQALEQHVRNPIHQAYLQYAALQAAHQKSHMNMQSQQQSKMQELMSIHAKKLENYQQLDQGTATCEQRSELKPPQAMIGKSMTANTMRTMQLPHTQSATTHNVANTNNQFAISQLQAMQAWALERNIDLSLPANANLMVQILPLWQSRMAALQKSNEINSAASHATHPSRMPLSKQPVMSSQTVASENSAHGDSSSDVSGQASSSKTRQGPLLPGSFPTSGTSSVANANNIQIQNQSERIVRHQIGNGIPMSVAPETLPIQYFKKLQHLNQHASQPAVSTGDCPNAQLLSQGGPVVQVPQQRFGFTKQQLHVLKAQILAFRRLKRGEGALPQEVLLAIAPPPLDTQPQQVFLSPGAVNQDRIASKNVEEHVRDVETNEKIPHAVTLNKDKILPKEEPISREEVAATKASHLQGVKGAMKESIRVGSVGKEEQTTTTSVKSESEVERVVQMSSVTVDIGVDRGKAVPLQGASSDALQVKKPNPPQPKDVAPTRKYHGPLFDFPFFTRKHDSFVSTTLVNNTNNLTISYDVKDLIFEEGMEVLHKKRTENLEKIGGLLTVNLERKRIRPDLVLRLKIEEKKLRLLDTQARVRDEVDQQQQEIMAMPDRPYRKFIRLCERQRIELGRQVQLSQKVNRERQLKSIFQWRKKLLEAHWAIRDARTARNRGIAKYHEKILRDFSKRKDEDRSKRMEALKNNDVDRYREMLLEQQTNIKGDAAQRYAVLSSFLSQTEEYLHKLGGKITAAKNNQEVEEVTNVAAASARSQGLSEEEVRAAATCAGEEVMIRNRFSEMNALRENASVNKYYNLAHAVNERVVRQPSMLRAGTLRDYQLVGLQWMLSLYNNKLNGILADEMGLGKTVQVMALIAYLMEFKGNYGPHLIIVPNAVLVNWKSELHNWLPSVSCIFYVGVKDQRSKLFSQVVCAMKFNVLVTTYEFVMYDRAKLSRIDWKYIIIDEAQRMKDRESVLARDLDRYHCQRRLLLTGTPLQNDLKELWSLLNLLLPEVFDNRKAFHDWFSKPFQKDGSSETAEDDWLETEKKVIIIHRLHQILEPFMLRRRVEDVEGSLPPKVSIVLRCRMSAVQGAIYDWVKSTGTIRVDPQDELRRVEKNPNYQVKMYKNLNNRCMELRKTCNHPLLNYPYFNYYSRDFIVRSCGKLWILDRILIKLHRTGHRVLLFSTMTKLLDILEEYLQWRRLVYRRIDGTTSLEDRESAIVDFNSPNSDCFLFLLSIRAAGRGLNLQTADTVVIYDPDPNPKNEEQAVARAHRIGQKREVKVIYMEAVVDKISSHQKEDELRSGGTVDLEDDLAGKDRYIGSIESLIRSNIQQYKIDMADEVINAGRFDQRTTHEERRSTLETLLHDEERYQETVHDVPSLSEVNRMIARSKEEIELFDQMDEDFDWTAEMMKYDQVPIWIRAGSREVNEVISKISKKPCKACFVSNIGTESNEILSELSLTKTERKRGRPSKKYPMYRELDDENGEDYETSSEERNAYSLHEEEGEIGDFEDEEISGAVGAPPSNVDQSGDEGAVFDGGYELSRALEGARSDHIFEEAGSSGSSEVQRLAKVVSPSISSQKFGSLSALDARPGSQSTRMPDELEEGEIALSGDSYMDLRQSGSCIHDRDDYEDEQVLQPTIKRKRSIRIRPRYTSSTEKLCPHSGNSSQFLSQANRDYEVQLRTKLERQSCSVPVADMHDLGGSILQHKSNLTSRRVANSSPKLHFMPNPAKADDLSRERLDGKVMNAGGPIVGMRMSDSIRRKCKNVISKLQRRINKDGHQLVPLLTNFWKSENSNYPSNILDLHTIDQRLDRSEYNGAMDFLVDVQLTLKSTAQYCGYSYEVRAEASKLQDLLFDIMKLAFPDMDFQEVRNAVSFSSPSPKQAAASQSKRNRLFKEVVENDPPYPKQDTASQSKRIKLFKEGGENDPGPTKRSTCRPVIAGEDVRAQVHTPKLHKESRVASHRGLMEDASLLTHPGELVIRKKKRKDRDKSRAGYVSPRSYDAAPEVRGPIHKEVKMTPRAQDHPHGWTHQMAQKASDGGPVGGDSSGGVRGAQWANPVKRTRTDSGKRRPSHL